jgi:hypothetical protein
MKFIGSDDKRMAKVNKARERIQEIDSELAVLETAPIPLEDIAARIDAWLEKHQADEGMLYHLTAGFIDPDGGGISKVAAWNFGGESDPPFNFLGELMRIQAAIQPEAIKAGLMKLIEQRLEGHEPGPPLADRPALRSKLEAEREKLELTEEKEIEKLEADGWLVHRRPDARPEIILSEVTA